LKVKITISYDGSLFIGSQSQKSTPNTVMGTFQRVLNNLGIEDIAIASGRTDRNVHATGQVLHVRVPLFWNDLQKLHAILNYQLPTSLHVRDIQKVDDNFHARYSAQRRIYRYILSTQEENPFEARYVSFVKKLDFKEVASAIKLFEGEHDFKNFMKTGSDSESSVRIIYKAMAYQDKGKTILYFEANGFLRSQIRLMVGFLLGISEGKLSKKQLKVQLTNSMKNEKEPLYKGTHSRKLAPPQGLYLAKIKY
jgi:tRNA pseudouridine38-40 synthase